MDDLNWELVGNESSVRLDTEWAVASALREVTGIALKGNSQPTYLQTLALAKSLFPELFDPDKSLLFRQQESDVAREYRQRATARSTLQSSEVSPLELIKQDIGEYEELIQVSPDNDKLRQRLNRLITAEAELKKTEFTEQQLILRDAVRSRKEFPVSGDGKDYREFQLDQGRLLRLRVLHPDKPEHLMGADVIYENYWNDKRVVRIAAIQYKVWENKVLAHDDRMAKQLERLQATFCKKNLCQSSEQSKRRDSYRLPFCVAFLRPTDRLQSADSRLVSSGYHVPVCVVEKGWTEGPRGGKRIESKTIRSETVTHKVFEELFNSNMLGSRYFTYEELEEIYKEAKIMDSSERIIIHAQEFTG